ncbi:trypsin-like peptidase domain-containing protein [Enterococcus dongliensis]|uniref:Trypsin-like peptidase domain-containing protein n=1 Tax=Enterococcus dongliensis TaxID=2559925 RepID=A0AAP5ND31_9ENTE|nr:trypsin-like peptidase domain-containing protein [Enterococcus dongliensis]MDT2597819.1 trypsin-like peptidase domain-containing protein [Enterococcus dongliensis]MDT2604835.1 trypsin-like peptidase domain-containing protein [Enterococcus dongliensis]MDT2614518.1 trypsin-like peptidase domain-containing protein [Enterococcus dongliensis]MDT2635737.1 trypsin-like peptidase domain-containing protein [Enterococcus dongliensis]MDT2638355.1 trypsin-like peptidase domain-containing protein [Enter
MIRKDITPTPKKSSGFFRRFGISLLGGILGAVLTIGIFYVANGSLLAPNNQSTSGSPSAGKTTVSNMKVNVNSDITDATNKVQEAVVSVINLQKQQSQSGLGDFSDIFGSTEEQQSQSENGQLEEASEGSGVIYKVEGKTAYIVTNNHVVENQDGLEVLLKDGSKVKATLVGTDAYTDLAVLKVESDKVTSIKPATFGDSSNLKVGEPAIALGSPLGSQYANSVTSGIISSLNRQVVNQTEDGQTVNINAIQTDAAINPGNSGGPLVNMAGQVVGINSSKIVQTESNVSVEGIGFAIPSNDVVNVINQLEKDGKVIRPALGISMVNLSDLSTEQLSEIVKVPTSVTNGVVVAKVQSATPADQAGLKKYDVITKIGDTEVATGVELQSALYKYKVGDTVKITYYRQNKKETVSIKLSTDTSSLQSNSDQQGNN